MVLQHVHFELEMWYMMGRISRPMNIWWGERNTWTGILQSNSIDEYIAESDTLYLSPKWRDCLCDSVCRDFKASTQLVVLDTL